MAIRVECYAGYRGEQEPIAFWLGEHRLAVRAIVDRWLAPTQRWFRVEVDGGNLYVLGTMRQAGIGSLPPTRPQRAAAELERPRLVPNWS